MLEADDVTVLTGWAEAVAYGPDRIPAVLADARSNAPGRTAMKLAQPSARLGDAMNSCAASFWRTRPGTGRRRTTQCSPPPAKSHRTRSPWIRWFAAHCSRCSRNDRLGDLGNAPTARHQDRPVPTGTPSARILFAYTQTSQARASSASPLRHATKDDRPGREAPVIRALSLVCSRTGSGVTGCAGRCSAPRVLDGGEIRRPSSVSLVRSLGGFAAPSLLAFAASFSGYVLLGLGIQPRRRPALG